MSPEDIDKLTIAEVRAIAERASEALKTLRELGLVAAPAQAASGRLTVFDGTPPPGTKFAPVLVPPASPFPCPACGREATEKPGEAASPIECQLCGNHLPLAAGAPQVLMTNKGPIVRITAAERAAAIGQPAFDEHGEPT